MYYAFPSLSPLKPDSTSQVWLKYDALYEFMKYFILLFKSSKITNQSKSPVHDTGWVSGKDTFPFSAFHKLFLFLITSFWGTSAGSNHKTSSLECDVFPKTILQAYVSECHLLSWQASAWLLSFLQCQGPPLLLKFSDSLLLASDLSRSSASVSSCYSCV